MSLVILTECLEHEGEEEAQDDGSHVLQGHHTQVVEHTGYLQGGNGDCIACNEVDWYGIYTED